MITLEELKKMDLGKLLQELQAARADIFKVKFEVKTGHEKATHKIAQLKKYIAQVSTLINQLPQEKVEVEAKEAK